METLANVARLDELLRPYAALLGDEFTGYRNHACRVLNFGIRFAASGPETREKLAIAAAFHDLGIWTGKTFDYLEPSEAMARAYLEQHGRGEWAPEIASMIHEHHKVTPCRADRGGLVEAFRRADWADVSRGVLAFGLPRRFLREVFAAFPNAGFHAGLARQTLRRLRSHPLSPLPMLRL